MLLIIKSEIAHFHTNALGKVKYWLIQLCCSLNKVVKHNFKNYLSLNNLNDTGKRDTEKSLSPRLNGLISEAPQIQNFKDRMKMFCEE